MNYVTFPRSSRWGTDYFYGHTRWTLKEPPHWRIPNLPDGEYSIWYAIFEVDMVRPVAWGYHSCPWGSTGGMLMGTEEGERLIRKQRGSGELCTIPVTDDVEGITLNYSAGAVLFRELWEEGQYPAVGGHIHYGESLNGKRLLVALFRPDDGGVIVLDYEHLVYYLVLTEPGGDEYRFYGVPVGDIAVVVSLLDSPSWRDPLNGDFRGSPKWIHWLKVRKPVGGNIVEILDGTPDFDLLLEEPTGVISGTWGQLKANLRDAR